MHAAVLALQKNTPLAGISSPGANPIQHMLRRDRLRNDDLLPNLVMRAYDGVVINRRLNDVRDMAMLANTMCDIILRDDDTAA